MAKTCQKPVPLPTPQSVAEKSVVEETPKEEALFEEVEVVQEKAIEENNLDQIAQKLKQESMAESTKEIKKTQSKSENSEASKKPVTQQKQQFTKTTQTKSSGEQYFVQVGSFSKYKPNKKFLDSITSKGYTYQFHKVGKTKTKY